MAVVKAHTIDAKNVFPKLGEGLDIDAVNFEKMTYIDLAGYRVTDVQRFLADPSMKFFELEYEEEQTE